jgi:hypothetical protein
MDGAAAHPANSIAIANRARVRMVITHSLQALKALSLDNLREDSKLFFSRIEKAAEFF